MSIRIKLSENLAVPVLHIVGEIDGDDGNLLCSMYSNIPLERRNRVVLDFSRTTYLYSGGFAGLIKLMRLATQDGNSIEFAEMDKAVRRVCEMVGLDSGIKIHETLNDALMENDRS